MCGNADFGNSEVFVLYLERAPGASGIAESSEGVIALRGRQEFYDRGDGLIAEVKASCGATCSSGSTRRLCGLAAREQRSFIGCACSRVARIEGTLLRMFGVSPGAGVVWLADRGTEEERICRSQKRQFDGERAAVADDQTLYERGGFSVRASGLGGLLAAGDPSGMEETVPFLDLCAIGYQRAAGRASGCRVTVVRHSLGGRWGGGVGGQFLSGGS